MSSSPQSQLKEYVMLSPEGRVIRVPEFVFRSFMEFIEKRQTGRVEVHFRDGGIASAEAVATKSYKNGNGNH